MRLFIPSRFTVSRGFTLIELALVMSIIGLVVGAVWATGSRVDSNALVNQASSDLTQTVANARSYYVGQNVSYTAVNAAKAAAGRGSLQLNPGNTPLVIPAVTTSDFCYYTALLENANIFPSDMVNSNGIANDPWSQATSCGVGTAQLALACNPGGCSAGKAVQLVVRYTSVPDKGTCSSLVLANAQVDLQSGLTQILVNNNAVTLPATAVTVNAKCTGNGPFNVDWYYNVGG